MFVWRINCSSFNFNTRNIMHECKENRLTPAFTIITHVMYATLTGSQWHLRASCFQGLRQVKLYWQPLWYDLNHWETLTCVNCHETTLDDLTRSKSQDIKWLIQKGTSETKSTIKVVHLMCALCSKSSVTFGFNTVHSWLHRRLWITTHMDWYWSSFFFGA